MAALRQNLQINLQISLWNQSESMFRPFDEEYIMSVKLIAKSCGFPFFLVVQAIQIEVAYV